MFRVQIDTLNAVVLRAFAAMFIQLAEQQEGAKVALPVLLDPEDNPATGARPAAEVFGHTHSGTSDASTYRVSVGGNGAADAATIFGGAVCVGAGGGGVGDASGISVAVGHGGGTLGNASVMTFDPNNDPKTAGAVVGTAAAPLADQVSASIPAAPPPAPSSAGVIVDATGLPWDGRIHAGTRTQTQKGEWKKRKGIDDATVVAVEGELRNALAIPVKPFTPLNAAPPPPPPAAAVEIPNVAPPLVVPAPPPITAQQPAASAAPVTSFVDLCKYVTGRGIPAERIISVCNAHGLAGLGLAAVRPDLIPALYADFSAA